MNIVATVQDTGTDDVTAVSPVQSSNDSNTGLVTGLDDAYSLTLNKLDLADGTIDNEVLIHRSFEFSSTPTNCTTTTKSWSRPLPKHDTHVTMIGQQQLGVVMDSEQISDI